MLPRHSLNAGFGSRHPAAHFSVCVQDRVAAEFMGFGLCQFRVLFFPERKRLAKFSLRLVGFVCDHVRFSSRVLDLIVFGSSNLETIPINVESGFHAQENLSVFNVQRPKKFGTENASR
jgi:hypothetical protein